MKLILSLFISTLLLIPVSAGTKVDFNITSGKLKVEPVHDYSSRLKFTPDYEGVTSHLSGFQEKKSESGGAIIILKLTRNGQTVHEFNDYDLNGKFEVWRFFSGDVLKYENKLDEKNLILERTVFKADGSINEVLIDQKNEGFFSERNIYTNNKIIETHKDRDGDGLFEKRIVYIFDNSAIPDIMKNRRELNKPELNDAARIHVAGIFKAGERLEISEKLTAGVINALGSRAGRSSIARSRIYMKQLDGRVSSDFYHLPNRFQIYDIVKDENPGFSGYVLYGKLVESGARTTVHYRLVGPDALNQILTGIAENATASFNSVLTAQKIADHIKSEIKKEENKTQKDSNL